LGKRAATGGGEDTFCPTKEERSGSTNSGKGKGSVTGSNGKKEPTVSAREGGKVPPPSRWEGEK